MTVVSCYVQFLCSFAQVLCCTQVHSLASLMVLRYFAVELIRLKMGRPPEAMQSNRSINLNCTVNLSLL